MKEIEILRDLLAYKIASQTSDNQHAINIRNPEVRQLFAQMRDDEMRDIMKLQQKIERLESTPRIVSKIFTSRNRY